MRGMYVRRLTGKGRSGVRVKSAQRSSLLPSFFVEARSEAASHHPSLVLRHHRLVLPAGRRTGPRPIRDDMETARLLVVPPNQFGPRRVHEDTEACPVLRRRVVQPAGRRTREDKGKCPARRRCGVPPATGNTNLPRRSTGG